jgi:hypothetical protein
MKDGSSTEPAHANKLLSMMFSCLKRAMVTVKTISEGMENKEEKQEVEASGLGSKRPRH